MSDVHKLSVTDYSDYKAYCSYFINLLGLKDYRIFYDFGPCETPHTMAEVGISTNGRAATIVLNTEWHGLPVTTENLRRSAFHEVMEILLHDIHQCAGDFDLGSEARQKMTIRATHVAIRRLENGVLRHLPFIVGDVGLPKDNTREEPLL